jgi:hypothetical protein avisC_02045
MSTNRNVANLSITIVKTLVKMAGLGRVAAMIDGGQEFLNLLADLKNDTLGNPNAEMIRSLNGAVKSELDAIQDALKHNGLGRKQVKQAADQLAEAARETIKNLAEDDDALIRAVQQPQCFAEQLRGHAAPLPDYSSDEMQAHYETLLDRLAEEFLTLAPWSTNFNRVALTSLLRCFPALSERIDRLEQHMDRRFDHIELGMRVDRDIHIENNQLLKGLSRQNASPIFDHVVFGSRPDVVAGDCFVPRGEQEQLNALIADPTRRRTVLMGMRGCGKTQLAATLAKQCEDANWNLVAWINAGSPDTIQSDLVELAKRLKIDTSDQPAQDVIVRRCLDHLKSAAPTDRLIVFDNVEDINHLTGLIPSGDGVRVVATTTNKVGWEDQGWNSIKVGVFDRNTSIEYLLTVTNSDDRDAADALAERLGDLPLAIAQAAATARNGDLSLVQYLDRLDSYRSERVIRPVPGDYYTDDVATALCMAIEDALDNLADATRQFARRQLGALALLAESGVPTRWLDPLTEEHHYQDPRDRDRAADDNAHDALTELIDRSIIQQSADGSTTMLHRLQAQALRESWNKEERKQACESAVNLLGAVDIDKFRRTDTESRRRDARSLIEQLHAIGNQKHSLNLRTNKQVTSVLSQTLTHARDLGLVLESVTLEEFTKEIEHALGPNDLRVLNVQEELAYMFMHSGRSSEAINMYEHILDARTEMQGSDHRDTLTTQQNLAYAYYYQGDEYNKAIKLLEHVYTTRQQLLGDDDVDTLMSGSYLALVYHADGRLQEAMSLYEQVIADRTRLIGADHEHTLVTRNNLAYAYSLQGLLPKAIDQYEQVLSARTRTLGALDRQTLMTRSDLALAYALNGELAEAVGRYESVLKDCANALGTQHPLTVDVRENLEAARRELAEQEESSHTEEHVED